MGELENVILTPSSPIHSGDTYREVTTLHWGSHVRCSNHYTVLWIYAFDYSAISWFLNPNCHSFTIGKKCHSQSNVYIAKALIVWWEYISTELTVIIINCDFSLIWANGYPI